MWLKILFLTSLFFINRPLELSLSRGINTTGYILEIKDIDLSIYFDLSSSLNGGLELEKISKKGGPLIISGHSGSGNLALFNDLEYLEKGNQIVIYHNRYKLTFYIDSMIYYQKYSPVIIPDDNRYLYLITCDKEDMQKQLLISAKLAKKDKI